jgi:cytochrome P450
MWAVTGHAEIKEVLADPQRFPSGGGYGPRRTCPPKPARCTTSTARCGTCALIGTDGDLHRRLRSP